MTRNWIVVWFVLLWTKKITKFSTEAIVSETVSVCSWLFWNWISLSIDSSNSYSHLLNNLWKICVQLMIHRCINKNFSFIFVMLKTSRMFLHLFRNDFEMTLGFQRKKKNASFPINDSFVWFTMCWVTHSECDRIINSVLNVSIQWKYGMNFSMAYCTSMQISSYCLIKIKYTVLRHLLFDAILFRTQDHPGSIGVYPENEINIKQLKKNSESLYK